MCARPARSRCPVGATRRPVQGNALGRGLWRRASQQKGGHVRLVPSARQISLYDEALDMVFKMEEEDRKLVWAVAHSAAYRDRGVQWTKIARMLSLNDPRIVRRRYKDALVKLYYKQ